MVVTLEGRVEPFSFISGNLRGWSTPEQDGEHAWQYRAPLYARLLRERSPHLVGFQEFHGSNREAIEAALPFHACALGGECGSGEYVPGFWDTRRFECLQIESFWLNKWRDVKAIGWDAENERSVTCVELRDLKTGTRCSPSIRTSTISARKHGSGEHGCSWTSLRSGRRRRRW